MHMVYVARINTVEASTNTTVAQLWQASFCCVTGFPHLQYI